MELKWEVPSFRDFTSHTLCKYVHHHVLHGSQLKSARSAGSQTHNAHMGLSDGTRSRKGTQIRELRTAQCLEEQGLILLIKSLTKLGQIYLVSILQLSFHQRGLESLLVPSAASVSSSSTLFTPQRGELLKSFLESSYTPNDSGLRLCQPFVCCPTPPHPSPSLTYASLHSSVVYIVMYFLIYQLQSLSQVLEDKHCLEKKIVLFRTQMKK